MTLEEKAKTAEEIKLQIEEMIKRNRSEHGAYSFEEIQEIAKRKWVRLEDARQEIDDCKTSWQNLKDTIPKFDAKTCFLETQLKACNRLIDEMQRERGEQKQKLQSPDFLEALAKLEHEQWMDWSKAIAPEINTAYYTPHLERWKKCWVPYSKLTDEQKEHDRVWARKIIEELLE